MSSVTKYLIGRFKEITMKQIKMFTNSKKEELEKEVNEFMKTVEVQDIKVSESVGYWTVIVIYTKDIF